MNAGQIVMPRDEARRRLQSYRRSVHTRVDAEYQAAERAYAALARGTPIVILSQAFALAPLDEKGRPRMAIARADEQQVRMVSGTGAWRFTRPGWIRGRAERVRSQRVTDPRALSQAPDGYALVPMVPPDVRGNRSLATHWILWEVEAWADRPINARPDIDPLLLRHLGGEAFAVVGQWDLTAIERAIMAGSRATT